MSHFHTKTSPPALGSPTPPVLGTKVVKQGEWLIWLFLKINLSTTISMRRSRRELLICLFIEMSLQITKLRAFPFLLLPYVQQRLVFYYDVAAPLGCRLKGTTFRLGSTHDRLG